jgi:WD40 repeat protein
MHGLDTSAAQPVSTLSWGSPEELLVGGENLIIWNVQELDKPTPIWTQKLANPVKFARFSHDAGLIATSGHHDRLVKIWRRLSYEFDTTRFDVSYLSHPTAITNMHWRKPWHAEQNLDNLLYTFCADNKIRVWSHSDPHARSVMQHVAEIDMNSSIQPRRLSVGSMSKRRYGFVLDSRDFSHATEKAVQNGPCSGVDHALEHLIEIANRSPEICIVLDGLGHMSAWGLESAGCKNKKSTTVFNVAHVDGMNISFGRRKIPEEDYAQICVFAGRLADSTLTILAHTYDGKIDWYDLKITEMFDPSLRTDRARLISSWTGHDASIDTINTSYNGTMALTIDDEEDGILWDYEDDKLLRKSRVKNDEEILQSILAADGKHVALLHPESVSVWNTESAVANMLGSAKHSSRGSPMVLVKLGSFPNIHLSLIDTSGAIETWRLHLPRNESPDGINGNHSLFVKLDGSRPEILADVLNISLITGQPHDDEVAVAVTRGGLVQILSCTLNGEAGLAWTSTGTFSTDANKTRRIRAVSSGKIASVDETGTGLSIWDMNHGWLEYDHTFPGNETIEQLTWTTTDTGQSILAVGFQFRIVILVELQFHTDVEHHPWAQMHDTRLRDFATYALGDLCWLRGSDLLIATGNQLFVQEIDIELDGRLAKHIGSAKTTKPFEIVQLASEVNASLAIFHPSYIHHLISLGRNLTIHNVLNLLHKQLKYWSEGDHLASDLGIEPAAALVLPSEYNGTNGQNSDEHLINEEKAAALSEYLANSALPQLSASNRARLGQLAVHFAALQQHQQSVDENALRYLYHSNLLSPEPPSTTPPPYRDIIFASRSTSQEILISQLTRSADGKLTWPPARRAGLFMWLADPTAAQQQMEIIARNEYTRADDRSPVACSLYYLALRKKSVLQGLWRMAPGLREQKNTLKLLANDFADPKWRTSALKNAYVLLSKRRFMYAAAFFLLGDALKDAVNVCVHQLGDVQLAVAVARVYGGDESVVLRNLLTAQILPDAVERGDRWCASWVFGMLGRREEALQALVRPLCTLLPKAGEETTQAKHWRNYDPTLAVLYLQLRADLAKDSKASYMGGVTEKEEWDFVLRCAAQYTRMGCDWLALDLVRNWDFLPRQRKVVPPVDEDVSEVASEDGIEEAEVALAERKKPPPTQFQEPSASSLLDSFGF